MSSIHPAVMSPTSRSTVVFFAAVLAAAAFACTDDPVTPPESSPAPVLDVRPAAAELAPGEELTFSAWLVSATGDSTRAAVSWSSTRGTVDAGGRFSAPAEPGPVFVVARETGGSGAADTSRVSVRGPDPAAPASIRVVPGEALVEVGARVELSAQVSNALGAALTDVVVAWRSLDPAVAAVDAAGGVGGAAEGETRVVAALPDAGLADSASIRVVPPPVGTVRVTPEADSVVVGDTVSFVATPLGARGQPLSGRPAAWTSSDSAVATVAPDGRATGVGPGTAVLSVSVEGVVATATLTVEDPTPVVGSVTVSPASFALEVGGSRTLQVAVADGAGGSMPGWPVTWSSSSPAVAAVSPDGRVTAVGPGSARIEASSGGVTGAATVQVSSPPPPPPAVATVELAPSSVSIAVGASVALAVTVRDAGGAVLTGRPVAWSVAAPSVAAVDPSGVVTGKGAGSTTVTATVEGVQGSATLTVTAPGGGSTLVDECQRPGPNWIWCDDFDRDRLSSYFEYNDAGGSFRRVSGVGVSGSSAMRARFSTGQVGAGALHLAVGRTPQAYIRPADAGTADYRELYWRVYVRNAPGWVGGGGFKLSRAFVFASPSSWAQAMIAHVWSGGAEHGQLVIDPARGTDASGTLVTTTYNDFANLTWLGFARSTTPLFDAVHVGSWYCVEAHVRLNAAGASDGVFELWIDDRLEAQRTGLNWLGGFDDYGLNAVFLENYWNGGAPATQDRMLDNFVVSTGRIGC